MEQHANSEDSHMLDSNHQIPQKVAASKGLDQARCASIAMHTLLLIHGVALVILPDDPQGHGADQGALHEAHDMHIPVQLGASIEGGVYPGEEVAREGRRDVAVGDMVDGESDQDLVVVQRQRFEREQVCDALHVGQKAFWAREGEWVVHCAGAAVRGWRSDARAGAEVARSQAKSRNRRDGETGSYEVRRRRRRAQGRRGMMMQVLKAA